MRTSALFGAKNFGIFAIYGVFAGTRRRVEPVRIFFGKKEAIFRDFVSMNFYGWPEHYIYSI